MNNQKGFSLIEVLAALVIITIILLSFIQVFIQTNKTSHYNNERLVIINLADATIERLKVSNFVKKKNTNLSDLSDLSDYFTSQPSSININGKTYTIKINASQSNDVPSNATYSEANLDFVKVVVTVSAANNKMKGVSEGYVTLQKPTK